jgi:hypothetical protein
MFEMRMNVRRREVSHEWQRHSDERMEVPRADV